MCVAANLQGVARARRTFDRRTRVQATAEIG
jgi:hypothetical protein